MSRGYSKSFGGILGLIGKRAGGGGGARIGKRLNFAGALGARHGGRARPEEGPRMAYKAPDPWLDRQTGYEGPPCQSLEALGLCQDVTALTQIRNIIDLCGLGPGLPGTLDEDWVT